MIKRLFYLIFVSLLLGHVPFAWSADRGEILSGETKIGLTIVSPSYMDTWTFNGQTGDRVIITAVPTSGALNTFISLYPPGGGSAEATNLLDKLDHQLLRTGLYTIVIEDFQDDHEGTYNITFLKIPGAVSSPEDPDGGPIASGQTISPGGTIIVSDMDAFQFYGQTGDRAIITAVPTSGALNTFISLYPPGGGPAEATNLLDKLDHQLLHTGLYTIVIEDFQLDNQGTYNITFLKIPGAVSSPEDPDGGSIASGQTISPGGTIIVSDMDAFQFYGQIGDRAIITAVPTSGALNTFISLYPPGGGPAEATNLLDKLDHQLLSTGLYTIVIEDFQLDNQGTYDISLTKIPSDIRPGIYNPSPAEGDIVCDFSGSFTWDPASGATGYDLYFGGNVIEPLLMIGDNLSSPSAPFPTLESGKIYDWHVVAHTPGGDIEGPYWWFEVSSTPRISAEPTLVEFGGILTGKTSAAHTVTVSNTCTADLIIGTVSVTGTNPLEFLIQKDECSGKTIAKSGQCSVDVVFSPTSAGPKSANLSIPSNDSYQASFGVPLTGTGTLPDLTPPTPNPMTWATSPHQAGTECISMAATTASDPTPPINYYFDFVDSPTGGQGGADSGWQSETSYTNCGLQANHRYGYRVKARDGSDNEASYSITQYRYTAIEAPTVQFGEVTAASIAVQSKNTPSGLNRGSSGLFIENITSQTNSGWKQNNDFWVSAPLSPNTSYTFRAKARNGDAISTAYSTDSATTLANVPGPHFFTSVTKDCIRANWRAKGNPSGTEYLCENTTAKNSSGWITDSFWDSCNLSCSTTYSFRVKARNGDGKETDWISLGSQWTQSCYTGLTILLQSPAYGTTFNSCSLIPTYQPTFSWTSAETFTKYVIVFFSLPPGSKNPRIPITQAIIPGDNNSWTPPIETWKKISTVSPGRSVIRDIYWAVVGIKSPGGTTSSDVGSFRIEKPQPVTINTPLGGVILPYTPPPTFNFNSNCNIKFRLEFSSLKDFSDPKKINGFTFTTNDPNVETVVNRTLTPMQWIAVRLLFGTKTGYFRIKAWDAINRETVSADARSFSIESSLIGTWDIKGTETVTVTLQGYGTETVTEQFYDEFTFNPDGTFQMIGMSGTWAEDRNLFTVSLPYDAVERYFEEAFRSRGLNVDITVTSIVFKGKENWINDTISGNIIMAMRIYIYNYGLSGTATAVGIFTGTRQKGTPIATLEIDLSKRSKSLVETISTKFSETIRSFNISPMR